MAKRKRFAPFWIWPANWGLEGDRRELAKAEYYLTGDDLEKRKIEIQTPEGSERSIKLLEVDFKHNKLSAEDYDYQRLETLYGLPEGSEDEPSADYIKNKADLDFKYNKITEFDCEKIHANVDGTPWFRIIGGEHKQNRGGTSLSFELDWNDLFVDELVSKGYNGTTDDEIVDSWFTEMCHEMMLEDLETPIEEKGTAFNRTRKETDDNGRSSYY